MRNLIGARYVPHRLMMPIMTRGLHIPALSRFLLLAAALAVGILHHPPPLRRHFAWLLMRRRALGVMAVVLGIGLALWSSGTALAQQSEPLLVANLRCVMETERVASLRNPPNWAGGEATSYDYRLTLPDGRSEAGRLYRSLTTKYKASDGRDVVGAETELVCYVGGETEHETPTPHLQLETVEQDPETEQDAQQGQPTDYDTDDDGLIEVSSREQLKAIHADMDGDGSPQSDITGGDSLYASAYPNRTTGMGCPQTGCIGYELTADLDFDANGSGDADTGDQYTNLEGSPESAWFGFGYYSADKFSAVFEGNGHVIKNLYIKNRAHSGFFERTNADAVIRNVGVEDLVLNTSHFHVGGLVGHNEGTIVNSYTTGVVSGKNGVGGLVGGSEPTSMIIGSYSTAAVTGSSDDVGGLVGGNEGTIVASYATGNVTGTGDSNDDYVAGSDTGNGHAIGGLVGLNYPGQKIIASYATGTVTAASGQKVGGLVGYNRGSIVASYSTGAASGKEEVSGLAYGDTAVPSAIFSYWDTTSSGLTAGSPRQGRGKTTAQLQGTTEYTGAFAFWNVDLDGDDSPDDPWDFGTTCQYPVLKYGSLDTDTQRTTCQAVTPPANIATDYDSDDDGLLEVSNLYQLNAIRWDLDGNGVTENPAYAFDYITAFPDPVDTNLGCPSTGCIGYELLVDLDMDTNKDGTVDAGDTFAVWAPIGTSDGQYGLGAHESFGAIFEGNDRTISNLRVRREAARGVGMFNSAREGSVIRNLGLVDVDVSSSAGEVGGLAGAGFGEISNSYVTGTVSGNRDTGGLAGIVGTTGAVSDSYATADVTNRTDSSGGGLAGINLGAISGSYATGDVTGNGHALGGLVGDNDNGRIKASYATGDVSSAAGIRAGGLVGQNLGAITASYATGDVSGSFSVTAGGLVGASVGSTSYSYSTGSVSNEFSNESGRLGGLIGRLASGSEISDSYWDTTTSGLSAKYAGTGKTTDQLQEPAGYTGIYANWNVDLDGDASGDDPWDFGNSCQYPVLKYGSLDPDDQRATCTPILNSAPNSAPTVSAAIADATIIHESGVLTVSLSGVFSDADYDNLTITASSSDETKATVSAAGYLKLRVTAKSRGTAAITVTADDGNGGTVSDTFTVRVKAAPVVASAIGDVTGLEAGATREVSLSGVFSDTDGDSLTVTAASSDEAIATVTVASDGSRLTVAGMYEGTATITVTAQDPDGNRVSDVFDVPVAKRYTALIAQMKEWRNDPRYVSNKAHTDRWDRALLAFGETVADTTLMPMTATEAQGYADRGWARWTEVAAALREIESGSQQQQQGTPNSAPTVAIAISDITIVSESGTKRVSLTGVFSDADGDSLAVSPASSNEAVATVSAAADYSTLTVTAKSRGTGTITVTASDGKGGTVSDAFAVKVKAAPVVASAIGDVSGMEVFAGQEISLSGVFSDADGDSLTLSASSSDNTVVEPALVGDALTVFALAEGTATITVTARDADGNTVSDPFDVSVAAQEQQQDAPPNQDPTVASPIADATIINESGTKQVSLTGVFSDGDTLTVTAASSDKAVATVAVASGYSSLTVSAQSRGTATITVTADDGNGGTVADTFTVRVKAAPVVASAIADVSLEVDATQDISLSGVFSDADTDTLTVSAASSADAIATVTVAADQSKLTVAGVSEGTATITVTAQDTDGNTVSDTFDVSVTAPQQQDPPEESPTGAPIVAKPLADVSLEGPPGWRTISLSGVFHDPDGDDLIITVVSSDHGVASMFVDGSSLTVLAIGTGTATITVTAADPDGNRVSASFEVTVTPPAS